MMNRSHLLNFPSLANSLNFSNGPARRTLRSSAQMGQSQMGQMGQMEIMGIAFIVLLVSVGFLFFLSFNAQPAKKTANPFVTYGNDQLATNFLAAALKTDICKDHTLEDLIVSCGMQTGQNCASEGIGSPAIACAEAHDAFDTMANRSLDAWKKEYLIKVTYPGQLSAQQIAYPIKTLHCDERMQNYKPASFYIPMYQTGQAIVAEVSICK